MEKPPAVSNAALEQFVLLAKNVKGAAAAELVKQVTEAPGVYVFGELLDMPNIKELVTGPHSAAYDLLQLFAYGTYTTYKEKEKSLPKLSTAQCTKLRHLTIVTLAIKNKRLPYTVLLKELDVHNLRELEDLIIEAVYADIVRGKLDQKHQLLEVDYAIGRDIQPQHVREITDVLEGWCSGCEALLHNIETQVTSANTRKDKESKIASQIEQEINNIKKSLKTAHQDEEQMIADSKEMSFPVAVGKKATRSKPVGLRGSGAKK